MDFFKYTALRSDIVKYEKMISLGVIIRDNSTFRVVGVSTCK